MKTRARVGINIYFFFLPFLFPPFLDGGGGFLLPALKLLCWAGQPIVAHGGGMTKSDVELLNICFRHLLPFLFLFFVFIT